jgi:hypothetical protein
MKGYGIRSHARRRWRTTAGSRHCDIGMERTAEPRQSESEDSGDGYFARQVKKAIQERSAVGCFPSPGNAVWGDCFGEIQCRPRNLKGQCIPDGPQVSFQSLITISVESVCGIAKSLQDRWTINCRSKQPWPKLLGFRNLACGECTSLCRGHFLRLWLMNFQTLRDKPCSHVHNLSAEFEPNLKYGCF